MKLHSAVRINFLFFAFLCLLACGSAPVPESSGETPFEGPGVWTFDTPESLGAWEVAAGEFWQYAGEVSAKFDGRIAGNGSLRLDLDFSPPRNQNDWSEVKIKTRIDPPLDMTGFTEFTFDFYYDPAKKTKGGFKAKIFAAEGALDVNGTIPLSGQTLANGWIKTHAKLELAAPVEKSLPDLVLGIVGSSTDYKGGVVIDNLAFVKGIPLDAELTKTPGPPSVVDLRSLSLPGQVALADADASPAAARLFAYLDAAGKSDYVLFGHQNDLHHKRGVKYAGSSTSDVKDITGSYAGVVGIDGLSLMGDEYPGGLTGYPADPVEGSARIAIEAAKAGAIITLSAHMPNFNVVHLKVRGADPQRVHFRGNSYNTTSGDVMKRILPGGDLNKYLNAYLDIIARWARLLDEAEVPVLFRPYHENMGSWFWWGASYCTPEGFKNVFRYTVEYLRDVKDVHNFLYVYSPDSSFKTLEAYESRYPGDGFVDVAAFDQYHTNAKAVDSFIGYFKNSIAIVEEMAKKHGKAAAVSETGLQVIRTAGNTICLGDNRRPEWFTEILNAVSPSDLGYFLVWADFAGGDYYVPYKTSPVRGVKMADPFIDFYNDPRSVFADGTAFYGLKEARLTNPAVKAAADETGYILAPAGGTYLAGEMELLASVKNPSGPVRFAVSNGEHEFSITARKDSGGKTWYSAPLSREQINSLGKSPGTINLYVGDKAVSALTLFFGEK
jgi:mannan endo-1,4-beta-mannosidase